jgi:hypothetical protein
MSLFMIDKDCHTAGLVYTLNIAKPGRSYRCIGSPYGPGLEEVASLWAEAVTSDNFASILPSPNGEGHTRTFSAAVECMTCAYL